MAAVKVPALKPLCLPQTLKEEVVIVVLLTGSLKVAVTSVLAETSSCAWVGVVVSTVKGVTGGVKSTTSSGRFATVGDCREANRLADPGVDSAPMRIQPKLLPGVSSTSDRESTRLNYSHVVISYAVGC
mgnify:CR=1 FL=1